MKKSATRPQPHTNQLAQVQLRPGLNHSQSLTDSNFAALWPTDFIFIAIKDLNLLKKKIKNQETGSILKVGYACLNWPHLHRAYVVTVPFILILVVQRRHVDPRQKSTFFQHFATDFLKAYFEYLILLKVRGHLNE